MNEANVMLPGVICVVPLLLFGAVYMMASRRGVDRARRGSSYSLRELAGELTPEEKRAQRLEDANTHNRNAASGAFHSGATDYIDANGKRVKL